MNEQSKSIFTSVTFWGIVAGVIARVAGRYGYTIDDAGLANDLVSLAAAGIALYGRYRASQPVHVVAPPASQ